MDNKRLSDNEIIRHLEALVEMAKYSRLNFPHECLDLINRQKAEIESLNSRIFALNDTNKILMDSQEVYWRNKVKEFAERLQSKLAGNTHLSALAFQAAIYDMHNLVEEMVGGR